MVGFLGRRAGSAVITLLLALSVAFVLTRASGNPVRNLLGETASQEQVAAVEKDLGFDQPLPVQFVQYIAGVVQGDLGESLRYGVSNLALILSRFPATLLLAVSAILIALVIGASLGVAAAWRENSPLDRLIMMLAVVSQSVPVFWLGLLLVSLFAIQLSWLPSGGAGSWTSIILPSVALATKFIGDIARITRSSMVEVMREQYIVLARVNGVRPVRLLVVHGLRNAAIPVVTLLGIGIGVLLSGSVTIEYVFAWPGLGSLIIDAVLTRDVTLVQACVVFGAIAFVVINFITDLMYGLIDPRVRTEVR